ncbi:anhydro-N-acetylmuramic acid kinase [Hydrocarboniclastica marina]|uniref:Anhydro-N-acetylmuramic acid kinase n=1 Tax=Hydrocarboniclastica marina TaxID=2259620 RepID=A0A4P7XEA1_9ALTE|nr:anhydro-N-acetylmuramic acid kinase [Hydrocarboniclastica marina]QCF24935.1 anhydro-N-acetylmuramic acid kinase [Hydrocarboniclastica marina]
MNNEHFVGLMSGTSMDAIDAVVVRTGSVNFEVLSVHSRAYPSQLRARLDRAIRNDATPDELGRLDRLVGEAFAQCALQALEKTGIPAEAVRAIGTHGQTIRHAPDGPEGFTLQIGDPNIIAERTGITTVGDFRRRDVAAGGQGAPLAPAFHQWFFRGASERRALLNLGGIANLTLIPAAQDETELDSTAVHGFDTGPANTLLDSWHHAHRTAPYDTDGLWARSGQVNTPLLQSMLSDPFFQRAAPKSTGREHFNLGWIHAHLQGQPAIAAADVQRTLLELTSVSIARAFEALPPANVFLCGGGCRNVFLVERLNALMPGRNVATTAVLGLVPEAVEGAAFAWLARQTIEGKPGNVASSTGAAGPRILGVIYPG